MPFNLNYFKENLKKFGDLYNRKDLFDKIARVARKAGIKVVYAVLLLYYASLDKNIPTKDRLMILAALGYFICPADLIPDALPGGFVDDMGALTFVLKTVWANLTPEVKARARARLEEWFGPLTDDEIRIPGL